jgi:hypothetical protein
MPRMILLTVFILNVAFPYGIADAHALQSGTGELTVTVTSESGIPIPEAYVTFRAEQEHLDRGACVTDTTGRCTLFVVDAPTDASGLIRGYLYLGDGNRPVIWPGGDLSITITTTDSGRIRPPADFIDSAKGTPTSTVVPTTAVISTRPSPTGIALSATGTLTVTPSPTATPISVSPEQRDDPPPDAELALPLGLILLAVIGLVGVGWGGIRHYQTRRQGTHS